MISNISKRSMHVIDNNIIFEKVWQEDNLVELKITAICEYVNAFQSCYVDSSFLKGLSEIISEYVKNYDKECYIEFGKKEGNFTPAFSMKFLPADNSEHVKIEVDVEIVDNETRTHRCCFYVDGELGQIERMGKELSVIGDDEMGEICTLCSID